MTSRVIIMRVRDTIKLAVASALGAALVLSLALIAAFSLPLFKVNIFHKSF